MGSRLEKPSSCQGQQSPQRPGSRSPAPGPHPSHCLPVSFIVESVPGYPLPCEPVRCRGQRLCLTPTARPQPSHRNSGTGNTLEEGGREAAESYQGKEKEEEQANSRRQTYGTPTWAQRVWGPPVCPGAQCGVGTVASDTPAQTAESSQRDGLDAAMPEADCTPRTWPHHFLPRDLGHTTKPHQ